MSVSITLTTAGLAALANAAHTGTAAAVIAAIGLSPSAITPNASATALPGEIKRLTTFGGTVVDAQTIHVSIEDDSADTYDLRSFALYLGDGTLLGIYGQADVIFSKSANAIGMLSADIAITGADAGGITFAGSGFTNPPASTTAPGVVRLATPTEAKAGLDTTIALSPAAAAAAFPQRSESKAGKTSGVYWELRPSGVMEQSGFITLRGGGNTESGTITLPLAYSDVATMVPTGNLCDSPAGNWSAGSLLIRVVDARTLSWLADTTDAGHAFSAGNRFGWRVTGLA